MYTQYKKKFSNHIYSYFIFFPFRDPQFKQMLDLFAMLKKGYCDGTKVRIGRLQNLISSSCIGNKIFIDISK